MQQEGLVEEVTYADLTTAHQAVQCAELTTGRVELDVPVGFLLVLRPLKGVLSKEHDIQHDPAGPHISHDTVIVLLVGDDLRSCNTAQLLTCGMCVHESLIARQCVPGSAGSGHAYRHEKQNIAGRIICEKVVW